MVTVTIDRKSIQVPEGTTIMEAAERAGIPVPHLCFLKDINEIAACRVCVVEVEGIDRLVPACDNQVTEGMVVHTNSPRVRRARKTNLKLILSQHDGNCTACVRSGNCSLQALANDLNIHHQPYHRQTPRGYSDFSTPPDPPGEQVHQVHALRPDLRQGPESGHLGRGRHRLPHHRGRVLQPDADEL